MFDNGEPQALGRSWKSLALPGRINQRRLPRGLSPGGHAGFPRQRRQAPDYQAKERQTFSLMYSSIKHFVEPLCG